MHIVIYHHNLTNYIINDRDILFISTYCYYYTIFEVLITSFLLFLMLKQIFRPKVKRIK